MLEKGILWVLTWHGNLFKWEWREQSGTQTTRADGKFLLLIMSLLLTFDVGNMVQMERSSRSGPAVTCMGNAWRRNKHQTYSNLIGEGVLGMRSTLNWRGNGKKKRSNSTKAEAQCVVSQSAILQSSMVEFLSTISREKSHSKLTKFPVCN